MENNINEKEIAQQNFMKEYTMGVKKPMDFVLGLTENKHGIDNPVEDLNTQSLIVGGTAILVGLLTIDASAMTVPRTYTAQDLDGMITLQTAAFTNTRVPFANSSGILVDDADFTFVTDTLTVTKIIGSTSITASSLTDTRVVFAGAAGLLTNSANLTFVTPALTIGVAGSATGQLKLTGVTSGTVTVQTASAAGTWTLTLPITGGTANHFLQTNGSGVTTWATGNSGDFVGPASSTDNAVVRFDLTTGKLGQNSGLLVTDITSQTATLDLLLLATTGKTFTFPNYTGIFMVSGIDTMTYAATIALDITLARTHKTTTVHATGNATINASAGGNAGEDMTIIVTNDVTGAKVITFGTNFLTTGTITGTVSNSATICFISDGTSWFETSRTLVL